MLTPNRHSYALGCSPSVKLDRPSHLDEILPQKKQTKQAKFIAIFLGDKFAFFCGRIRFIRV